jgi:hypothetical protein
VENTVLTGFRLSPQQEYLWSLPELHAGVCDRSVCSVRLEGPATSEQIRESLEQAIARHEILRTVFSRGTGMKLPFQVILDACPPQWLETDLTQISPERKRAQVKRLFQEERISSLRLDQGPVVRGHLVRMAPDQQILILSVAALCADTRSLQILVSEIAGCLEPQRDTNEGMQYADVTEWQHSILESGSEEAEASREFWRSQPSARISLPLERKGDRRFDPSVAPVALDAAVAAQISSLAAKLKVAEEDVLAACWHLLLSRLCGSQQTVVHQSLACREYAEIKDSIGPFSRYLPIAANFAGSYRFNELVQLLNKARLDASERQEYFVPRTPAEDDDSVGFDYQDCYDFGPPTSLRVSLLRLWACSDRYKMKLVCLRRPDLPLRVELHCNRGSDCADGALLRGFDSRCSGESRFGYSVAPRFRPGGK